LHNTLVIYFRPALLIAPMHTLLNKARQFYHVYHLHIKETGAGSKKTTMDGWKQLLGDNLIIVERHEDISKIIPQIVAKNAAPMVDSAAQATKILL
jgi:hypothetical protein